MTKEKAMTHVRKAKSMAPGEVSPKALLALVLPAGGTLVLALVNELLSPSIDSTLKVAIVGVVNALLAAAGAWVGKPGSVVVND